jgi:hypothetical protein
MFNINEEREKLTQKLSEEYSQNIINIEEYERILEYINKIETKREASIIEKIIRENTIENDVLTKSNNDEITIPKISEKHLSAFSWRTTNLRPINGSGGKYTSLFGANRIIVDDLPKGRTIVDVNSIFGLTEIIISARNIKITSKAVPIFSGIFMPVETNAETNRGDGELPELYITGKAVFGNITVKTIEELQKEVAYEKKLEEKIKRKIYDKM